MIEAMARGCPCIGATVAGIPELLPPEDMVRPGDENALARKIFEVLGDPDRMERMARRNWETAKEYLPEILVQRRRAFYTKVRELSARNPRVASLSGRVPEAV
jgi:glycosyltransferase involved in cell wall biosynthesis